jgi:hypothetical protein
MPLRATGMRIVRFLKGHVFDHAVAVSNDLRDTTLDTLPSEDGGIVTGVAIKELVKVAN